MTDINKNVTTLCTQQHWEFIKKHYSTSVTVMIRHMYQNREVFASLTFYLLSKLICIIYILFMNKKREKRQTMLTSIPEKNENEEDAKINKWVPKKKHEVLKAKYKCLKKLFQIYDASVIGILPEPCCSEGYDYQEEERRHTRRKRRSHMTKTDACAGTTEVSSGDVSIQSEDKCSTIATAVIRDLKIQCSCSTQMMSEAPPSTKFQDKYQSKENLSVATDHECGCTQTSEPIHPPHPLPYLMVNERRKPTRFQSFMQRLFGLRRERAYKNYVLPNGHIYAASDNNFTQNFGERRRRRGLRFRRLKRPKKILSESALRDMRSPVILTYVQSVQRNCLMDTTPRQCPIVGCRMIFYGIINYNDHLNLCHFTERKYICHYCHEGFEREYDKYVHENEHLGINKLNTNIANLSASTVRHSAQKASNTQTDPELKIDVPDDKLKKIVSFFDKIVDNEQIMSEIKKNRYSESNLQTIQRSSKTESDVTAENNSTDSSNNSSEKRTVSCSNMMNRTMEKSKCNTLVNSDATSKCPSPVRCRFCGENFDFRRQLSLHVDLEHRMHDKFSKFHSCAGIINRKGISNGKIKVQSVCRDLRRVNTSSTLETYSEVSRRKSDDSLSCDPSTNIIYYESLDSVKKPSVVDNFVNKVRSVTQYKWEPGTKIIRV